MTKYISREQESELAIINQFYTELKAKMTGQVINGTLTGCLLESEIDEVYRQVKERINDTDISRPD